MNKLQWIGLALAAFIVGLLITAPARLILPLLPADQLVIQGVTGSLWRGSAATAMVKTEAGYLHLGEVDWKLSRLALLRLGIKLQLDSRWGQQQFHGHVLVDGADSFSLVNVHARLPAALAQRFAPVALDGTVRLALDRVDVEQGLPVAARGQVLWEQAVFVPPRGTVPLGSYVIQLDSPEKGTIMADLASTAGPLLAEGTVELSGRAYKIDALLRNTTVMDPGLERSLSLFAAPEGDAWRVALEAEL